MKKKILISLCLSAVISLGAGGVTAYAEQSTASANEAVVQEQIPEFSYKELEGGTLALEKYGGDSNDIVIPEEYDGKAVSAISAYAVGSNAETVAIPRSVTTIEEFAIGYDAGTDKTNTDIVIKCFEGSAAYDFAVKYGFRTELHKHSFVKISETPATCSAQGKRVYKCTECDEQKTETIAKKAHTLKKVSTKAPTISTKGYTTYKCTVCGQTVKSDYKDKLIDISKLKETYVKASYTYTGNPIKPGTILMNGKTRLKNGTDYTVTYSANTKVGTAKVIMKGKGKYGGTKTVTFKILARNVGSKALTYSGPGTYYKYTGKAVKPSIKITHNGRTLKAGTDYTLTYKKNTGVGTGQIIIKGKGNYRASVTKTFKIVRMGWLDHNGYRIYYNNKGVRLRNGVYKIGSDYYSFMSNGGMETGWKKVGNYYYLFDRKTGKRVSNTTVDGVKINKNGTAVMTDWSKSKIETMMRAHSIMLSITNPTDTMDQKRLKCFNWVLSFPYHRYRLLSPIYRQQGWEMTFANDIFINHQGCCVAEASATAFLFREIGYSDVAVCHDTAHSWTTIGKYLYDPVFAEAKDFWKNYNILPYDYRVNPVDRRVIG